VYDSGNGLLAPRVWWCLSYHGHPAPLILDGGYARWVEEGRSTDLAEPCPLTASPDLQQWHTGCNIDQKPASQQATDKARQSGVNALCLRCPPPPPHTDTQPPTPHPPSSPPPPRNQHIILCWFTADDCEPRLARGGALSNHRQQHSLCLVQQLISYLMVQSTFLEAKLCQTNCGLFDRQGETDADANEMPTYVIHVDVSGVCHI